MNLETALVAFIAGVALAAAYTYYIRTVIGGFVRKLFELEAFDPQSAVSAEDAGYGKNKLVKHALREGTDLAETVRSEGGRYYIPEERIEKAEKKYAGESMSIFVMFAIILGIAVLAIAAVYIAPELTEMLTGLFK